MKQVETEYGRQTWVLLNAGVSVTLHAPRVINCGRQEGCLSQHNSGASVGSNFRNLTLRGLF